MSGPECSLLALCDGSTARALPLAQDHKRIGDGDTGANTGGMGAYAPAPVDVDVDLLVATFVQPVLDHLRAAGTPYVGILYAGLMLTADGPRLVEYNVRFGDPEAQAVLPLLRSDLAALAMACVAGRPGVDGDRGRSGRGVHRRRRRTGVPRRAVGRRARSRSASCRPARSLFPAGLADGVATGGRVLAVTGLGADLAAARGRRLRRHRSGPVRRHAGAPGHRMAGTGRGAGVVRRRRRRHRRGQPGRRPDARRRRAHPRQRGRARRRQLRRGVLGQGHRRPRGSGARGVHRRRRHQGGAGGAAGPGRLGRPRHRQPLRRRRARAVGHAAVLPRLPGRQRARRRPGRRRRHRDGRGVRGRRAARCSAARRPRCRASTPRGRSTSPARWSAWPSGRRCSPAATSPSGDVLVGVASSGPHTNGYSLLRDVFRWAPMDVTPAGMDRPLGDALLEPHRSYLPVLRGALAGGRVKALAHITGGGLPENVPRVLPAGVDAEIDARVVARPAAVPPGRGADAAPRRGRALPHVEHGRRDGRGVRAADAVAEVQAAIPEPTWVIGRLVPSNPAAPRRPPRVTRLWAARPKRPSGRDVLDSRTRARSGLSRGRSGCGGCACPCSRPW